MTDQLVTAEYVNGLLKDIERLTAREKHLFDLYEKLGIKWGDDPFMAIERLTARNAVLEAVAKEAAKWLNNDPKRTYSALEKALSKLEEKDSDQ
jgi:hypothetical protein